MNKADQQDTVRTNELKLHVWAHVAMNLLHNNKNPYEIKADEIEKHKGKRSKAIRLLEDTIEYEGYSKGVYRDTVAVYNVQGFEDSKSLAVKLDMLPDINIIHDYMFGYLCTRSQENMDTCQYSDIKYLSNDNLLYVYWHREEYQFVEMTDKNIVVYPKAYHDLRTKYMVRAIIDHYLHIHLHDHIEHLIGVPAGSIKTNDNFQLTVRNFAAHGYRFSTEAYFGTGGFKEEYTHFKDYFEALLKNLEKLQNLIQKAGGQENIIAYYRKNIITILIEAAPLYIFQPYVKSYDEETTNVFTNPYLNSFLLRNAQYLDYDTLYGEDTSILKIGEDETCIVQETYFTPNPEEINMIKGV
jgi:hypothetical protein